MTTTQIIQKIGLAIFILGFGSFLWLFGSENYKLDASILKKEIDNQEKLALVLDHAGPLLTQEYKASFSFVSQLKSVFAEVNQLQLDKYKLTDAQVEKLAQLNAGKAFSLSTSKQVFDLEAEYGRYQFDALSNYGGWLEGRTASSKELGEWLNSVKSNIEKYGIINQKGFDQYQVKHLIYSVTKKSSIGVVTDYTWLVFFMVFGATVLGSLVYIFPNIVLLGHAGIKNDHVHTHPLKSRGWLGWLLGSFLIAFYVVLYFFPEYMTSWILLVDPLSILLKGSEAGRFFLYGFIYTVAILVMGVRMMIKYRHSNYQLMRTASVMFFQLAFAFIIPEILLRLNQPYFDFKNIWPLDYDFFFDNEINTLMSSGGIGIFMLGWGIGLTLIGVPVMVYFFGKRWYCSWVCGCGGLAETLGDPFRQLSDKSLKAWKFERYSIHLVLVFAIVMTIGVLYTYWTGESELFGMNTYTIRSVYGAWIGAGFAGVVGTGFYPLMGNRAWCRFGCPLAAYLGLVQRFKSRFRITTNGGQCISCGNCSTHCEMGIDVRWYAQRGENIVRSSCVGCGVCSSVCPRGVLNLENISGDNRLDSAGLIGNNSFPEIVSKKK